MTFSSYINVSRSSSVDPVAYLIQLIGPTPKLVKMCILCVVHLSTFDKFLCLFVCECLCPNGLDYRINLAYSSVKIMILRYTCENLMKNRPTRILFVCNRSFSWTREQYPTDTPLRIIRTLANDLNCYRDDIPVLFCHPARLVAAAGPQTIDDDRSTSVPVVKLTTLWPCLRTEWPKSSARNLIIALGNVWEAMP